MIHKALVLGGTKFFGKRLVQLLLDNNIEVTIGTRGLAQDSFGDRVKRLILDREDRDSIEKVLGDKSHWWDVVFDQSCFSANAALYTCETLAGKVGKYVLTSSAAVYTPGVNLKEDDFDPKSYPIQIKSSEEYSGWQGLVEAKRVAEAILFQKGTFPVVAARVSFVIGSDDYTQRLKFHVDHVIEQQAILFKSINSRISVISSHDTALILLALAQTNVTGPYNVAYEQDVSLTDLIHLIEKRVGKSAVIREDGHPSPYDYGVSLSLNLNNTLKDLSIDIPAVEKVLIENIDYYIGQHSHR
jgi:nucleoside-diphosphate-sugar epimerase